MILRSLNRKIGTLRYYIFIMETIWKKNNLFRNCSTKFHCYASFACF